MRARIVWIFFVALVLLFMISFVSNQHTEWSYGYSPKETSILKVDVRDLNVSDYSNYSVAVIKEGYVYVNLSLLDDKEMPYDPIDHFPRNGEWPIPTNLGSNVTGVYTFNNEGLRSLEDYSIEKTNTRIILLGDSFVWGAWVLDNETSSYYLQEKLGNQFDIFNFGIFWLNTEKEVELLQKRGLKYNPDLVIILFHSTDLEDTDRVIKLDFVVNKLVSELNITPIEEYGIQRRVYTALSNSQDFEEGFETFVLSPLQELSKLNIPFSLVSFPVSPALRSNLVDTSDELNFPLYFLDEEIGYDDSVEKWRVWDGHSSAYANNQIAIFLEKLIRQEFEGIENGR